MKKLLFSLVIILSASAVNGQKSVNRLIDKMKDNKHAYAVTLPGWLIRTGIKIADEEELRFENGFADVVDGIKRLRVLYIDDKVDISSQKMSSLVNQIKEKDGYVDYAIVREEDNRVHVIVKEDDTRIKSLVLVASSSEGFTILNLKTDIDMEDLKNANLSFNKNTLD